MTTPEDRGPDPATIAAASFTTVRRGYDPTEVRSYLQHLSNEVRAMVEREAALRRELDELVSHPSRTGELDEATVAAWLGEEAARVLTTAREAAAEVRARADEYAEQRREEVAAEVARLREEVNAEVARLREEVEAEIARRRQETIAEAEAEIEAARQEGRSMVSEARAVRERMLADLARRRDAARAQLAALRGERDRIVNAIEATRDHLDRLMDDLRSASPEDERDLPSMPYDQDLRAVTSEPRLTLVRPLHPVHQEREEPPAAERERDEGERGGQAVVLGEVAPEAADEGEEAETAEAEVDDAAAEPIEPLAEVVAEDESVDEAPAWGAAEAAEGAEEVAAVDESAEAIVPEEPTAEAEVVLTEPGADDEPTEAADEQPGPEAPTDAPPSTGDEASRPSVDDLFARIRAARSEAVAPTGSPAGSTAAEEPTAEVPVVGGPAAEAETAAGAGESDAEQAVDPDTALLRARDAALAPLRANLARQLKRALADEQNEVFDRLRRLSKIKAVDDVLGPADDHAERYRASGEDAVWAAALAGASTTAADPDAPGGLEAALERHRVLDDVLDEVTSEVTRPLRERLEAAVAAAEGQPDEATTLLRNAYREWKSQRMDELAAELVSSAYGRGAFAAAQPGAAVRWVVDPDVAECRDEVVNEDAGPVPAGEPFPTGHRHPPAHAGCRCLLAVARD